MALEDYAKGISREIAGDQYWKEIVGKLVMEVKCPENG